MMTRLRRVLSNSGRPLDDKRGGAQAIRADTKSERGGVLGRFKEGVFHATLSRPVCIWVAVIRGRT